VNIGHEPNNCVRAAAPGTLTMAMNPERLVEVEPEWVGLRMRAEAMVGNRIRTSGEPQYWSFDPAMEPTDQGGPVQSLSCYASWGWSGGVHPGGSTYPDFPRGKLYFLDSNLNLLDAEGVSLGPVSCTSPPVDTAGPEHVADVRPLLVNFANVPVGAMSFSTEVPLGAAWVGVRIDVPGVNGLELEPVISDVTVAVETPRSPRIRGEVVGEGAEAYGMDPITGAPSMALPGFCDDRKWFVATSGGVDPVSFFTERSCLALAAQE
jgi:hypothetical protein